MNARARSPRTVIALSIALAAAPLIGCSAPHGPRAIPRRPETSDCGGARCSDGRCASSAYGSGNFDSDCGRSGALLCASHAGAAK